MLSTLATLAPQSDGATAAFSLTFMVIVLAICVVSIAGVWMTMQKAGQPGWASLVPIYNMVVLLRIATKPWWWLFLCIIPLVNLVIVFMVGFAVARNFGKGVGFGLGLVFLGPIFYCILGFGDARWEPVA